jgi:hypothetical protein
MKKIKLLFFIVLIGQFFFSCKKEGELIEAKSYGSFNISSTTTTEVGNLLVDVDGKITDTLKAPSAIKTIKAYIGKRKIKIYQPGKSSNPIIDTTLDIKGVSSKLTFLYTGDLKIIGGGYDGSVQLVNLENSLPAAVDMKIYELYFNDMGDLLLDETATIKGINKFGFSNYIEIPPPKHGDFSAGGYYFELFDPKTNNKLVDFNTDFPSILFEQFSQQFMPNKVMSLGIIKDPNAGVFTTSIIYETEIK